MTENGHRHDFTNFFDTGNDLTMAQGGNSGAENAPDTAIIESNATSTNTNTDTPNILLEQLAFVDNIMPAMEHDFVNLDHWIMNDMESNPNTQSGANGNSSEAGPSDMLVPALDEVLAIELSAFADESFIFPDEDKPVNKDGDKNDDSDDNDSGLVDNVNYDSKENPATADHDDRRDPHFLTKRRNNFLASQYDISKSRISGNRKKLSGNIPPKSSPLTKIIASDAQDPPISVIANDTRDAKLEIELPDYTSFTTAMLTTLLPKVKVPASAQETLLLRGYTRENVDALATLVAYHEQHRAELVEKDGLRSNSTGTLDNSLSVELGLYKNPDTRVKQGILEYPVDGLHNDYSPENIKNSEEEESDILVEPNETDDSESHDYTTSPVPTTNKEVTRKASDESLVSIKREKSCSSLTSVSSHKKRKLKEKELEGSIQKLSDLAMSLQQRIHTLEMENNLLKNLVLREGDLESLKKENS